jgi:hypothetical protein
VSPKFLALNAAPIASKAATEIIADVTAELFAEASAEGVTKMLPSASDQSEATAFLFCKRGRYGPSCLLFGMQV